MWQSRHMAYHVMLGLLWAWFLRERWGEFNAIWIFTAVVGSILPDGEHLYYFVGYGRTDTYAKEIFLLIKNHHWRQLFHYIATGHKHNTSLAYHNIYTVGILLLIPIEYIQH